jgi:hypothetical protein
MREASSLNRRQAPVPSGRCRSALAPPRRPAASPPDRRRVAERVRGASRLRRRINYMSTSRDGFHRSSAIAGWPAAMRWVDCDFLAVTCGNDLGGAAARTINRYNVTVDSSGNDQGGDGGAAASELRPPGDEVRGNDLGDDGRAAALVAPGHRANFVARATKFALDMQPARGCGPQAGRRGSHAAPIRVGWNWSVPRLRHEGQARVDLPACRPCRPSHLGYDRA